MTFTDPVVAQKVVNMRDHTIRKSNLNVSFADPRGSGGVKAPQFTTDPFAIQLGYRHAVGASPRYAFSGQHPQAYTVTYGAPQHNPSMVGLFCLHVQEKPRFSKIEPRLPFPRSQAFLIVTQLQLMSPYEGKVFPKSKGRACG